MSHISEMWCYHWKWKLQHCVYLFTVYIICMQQTGKLANYFPVYINGLGACLLTKDYANVWLKYVQCNILMKIMYYIFCIIYLLFWLVVPSLLLLFNFLVFLSFGCYSLLFFLWLCTLNSFIFLFFCFYLVNTHISLEFLMAAEILQVIV